MVDRHPKGRFPFNRLLLIFCLAVVVISLQVMAGLVLASSDLTGAQLLQLENGDVLVAVSHAEGSPKGTVEATILIDASAERIWQIMVNCSEIPTFVPGVKDCQVLASGENWEIIRHDVKWMWLFPKLSYVFRARYQQNRQINFARIEGDLRDMRGSWRLTPLPNSGQTLVRYRVFLDPGFWVPQWIVRNSLKRDLPAVLTALRTKVLDSLPGQRQ
jgi:ribosome-associated toxin RatA of RatAB toxin-antitoxin module